MQIVKENGEEFVWNVFIKNRGQSNESNFSVDLIFPDGVSLVESLPSQGIFTTPSWSGGYLGSGNDAVLTLEMVVDDITKAPFKLSGTVNSSGIESELLDNIANAIVHSFCSIRSGCELPVYIDDADAIANDLGHGDEYRVSGTGDITSVWNPPLTINLTVLLEGAQ